jgi:hypothetical protein
MYGCAGWEFVMTSFGVWSSCTLAVVDPTVGPGPENVVDGFDCRCWCGVMPLYINYVSLLHVVCL